MNRNKNVRKGGNTKDLPFFEVVNKRVSVREYRSDPVQPEHLKQILEAARRAPNAGNQQAWRFLVVQDPDTLDKFREVSWRRRKSWLLEQGYEAAPDEELREHYRKILGAPLLILVLVDKTVRWKGYHEKDGALAAGHIMLAARALGYGSVMLTGTVSEDVCREFFEVPDRYSINCTIPIGFPDSWPPKRSRKPLKKLIFYQKIPT